MRQAPALRAELTDALFAALERSGRGDSVETAPAETDLPESDDVEEEGGDNALETPDSDASEPQSPEGLFGVLSELRTLTAARRAVLGGEAQTAGLRGARSELLHLLGLVAAPEDAPRFGPYLGCEADAEATLAALSRVPGAEATLLLMGLLVSTSQARQERVAQFLGERGDPSAIDGLKESARGASAPLNWGCLTALARLGVPPAEVLPPASVIDFQESVRYAGLTLRAAQVMADGGQKQAAEKALRSFFQFQTLRYQVRAGLAALEQLGSPESVKYALGYLNAPGVRETGIRVLAAAKAPGVEESLVRAYQHADPLMRAAILEVLVRRNAAAAPTLLQQALKADAPALRFTAASLAGVPPSEEDLGYLALQGDPAMRQRALRAFLDLAHSRAITGQSEAAAGQFRAVVDGPFPLSARREALEGLGQLGFQEDRALVGDYVSDPRLSQAAYVALSRISAAQADPELAREELSELARTAPSEEAQAVAVEALTELGDDTADFGSRHGFLTEWRVLGPFPNVHGDALGKAFFDERRGDALELVDFNGVTFSWGTAQAVGLPALVDLQAAFGPYEDVAAYAVTRVNVPKWTAAELCIGTDEGYELWVNGKRESMNGAERPFKADADCVPVGLKPGVNRLMIKVLQGRGDWKFCVRVSERAGTPLDLSQQRLPEDGTTGVGVGVGAARSTAEASLP
ncbi:MAG: hypothetical protein HYV26_23710 [Candidatus Hydrogenedentes bacterium]|nr:hypothetical protein [Candidatus Hydrogenedentota bacterium]